MTQTDESELRNEAEQQSHDGTDDLEATMNGPTEREKAFENETLRINEAELQDEEVGAPAKIKP